MLTEIFLILALTYIALLAYFNYSNKTKGVPHIGGLIPYVGVTYQWQKDPIAFLNQLKEKYGEVFSITVMGKKMIFFTNPEDYKRIMGAKESTFSTLKTIQTAIDMFGGPRSVVAHSDQVMAVMKITRNHIEGQEQLADLVQRTVTHYSEYITKYYAKKQPQRVKLMDLAMETVLYISNLTLLGKAYFPPDIDWTEFLKAYWGFENNRLILLSSLPEFFKTSAKEKREKWANYFKNYKHDEAARVMIERGNYYNHLPEHEWKMIQHIVPWAALTNTGPSTFWMYARFLTLPSDLKEEILREVKDCTKDALRTNDSDSGIPIITLDMLNRMVKLQALCDETLRFYSYLMFNRYVPDSHTFTMSNGNQIPMAKDDEVFLTTQFVHMNKDVFEDPQEFKPTRFSGTKTYTMPSTGKVVSVSSILMPFGLGTHVCPGRFWGTNEVKLNCAYMMLLFNGKMLGPLPDFLKLYNGSTAVPLNDVEVELTPI